MDASRTGEGMGTIVVGAGVIGAASALLLLRQGRQVTLIDRAAPGEGASFGNAGSLSAGSVVPMATPGMVQQVPRWLFDKEGPLAVRWTHLPKALPWLIGWLRASRRAVAETSAKALRPLMENTVAEWRDLLRPEDRDRLIRQKGQLLVSRNLTPDAGELFAQALREANGVVVEAIGAEELRQLEPALSPDYKRGLYMPASGHTTDPQAMVQALVEQFVNEGGRLLRGDVVTIEASADGVALETAGGRLAGEGVVIAAGARSLELMRQLGDSVPLESERGYHCVLPNAGLEVQRPTSDMDRKFFVTSMEAGLRIAGTVEIAGTKAGPNYERAHMLVRQAKAMLPGLDGLEHSVWMGHRPSIPDSLPVIDRSRRHARVWYALGHGHVGLTTAPATARLVTQLVAAPDGRLAENPYRIDRF